MRVVLGVSGGIAAYKAATLLRLLRADGHDVTVVPTASALRFVGEPTWSALSGHPVATDVWTDAHDVPHVSIGRTADLLVVAPATADLLARAAHGLADDLLTSTLLTVTCPVLLAPAMHTEMWEHPATRANVALLRERGVTVVDPAVGRLTGADTGQGRLPEPEELLEHVRAALAAAAPATRPQDLAGRHVVVTAGGTREPLDPVRFLGNASSGRQGIALAEAARDRGADVHLVAAHVETALPDGVRTTRVGTAQELLGAVTDAVAGADVLVMAAAVADYRPAEVSGTKIKKTGESDAPTLRLVRTVDVLATVSHDRPRPGLVVVGFAAETGDETGDVRHHAEAKLRAKGCDLLVVNDVSGGAVFGSEHNQVVVLAPGPDGAVEVASTGTTDKRAVAETVVDAVVHRLAEVARAGSAQPVG
ncbi:bifunctional phosphopantothenoylcysteine decarboxylase/phosphopantothenate--cysteine ligase CoaBC [Aquipuribacter sp. MA13-6]|uniref:bifunctional phosphopantothenoylcysteine decarboxylase/phosphopantothenate--cysteine ligase CoaBC n=1 Tax=unclassified Aquipuribacter TaxID=2635084 RepID=UPI003EE8BEF6